jgi:hypothetical protein
MSKNKESWVNTDIADIDWKIFAMIFLSVIVFFSVMIAISAKKENSKLGNELKILRNVEPPKPPEIADLFEQELKKDPAKIQEFTQKVVDMAVKKHPGMAIQVESYASEELKKQMQELRERSEIQSLLRLDAEVMELKKQITVLKEKADRCDSLEQQLSDAVKKNEQLSASQEGFGQLQIEYNNLKARVDAIEIEGAPVVVWNDWAATACFFEIINIKTEKKCSFFLDARGYKIINLLAGDYTVNYFSGTSKFVYKTEKITVTPYVSADFPVRDRNGKIERIIKCHGLIITP